MSRNIDDKVADLLLHTVERIQTELSTVLPTLNDIGIKSDDFIEELLTVSKSVSGPGDATAAFKSSIDTLVATTRNFAEENIELKAQVDASNRSIQALTEKMDHLVHEATTDPLTQIPNRRFLDDILENAVARAEKEREPLSYALVDIDHFKLFNDQYGHQTGDYVLRLVANILSESVKGQDTVARYGGEEFAILLPDTPIKGAVKVSQTISRRIRQKRMQNRRTKEVLKTITVSVGVAQYQPGENIKAMIARADGALYQAKDNGRDQVVAA